MNHPYTICHMCTSIDGKILSARWGKLPGDRDSRELFETTATKLGVNAWLVGTTTMKEFSGRDRKLPATHANIPAGDFVAHRNPRAYAIGVDAKAVLRFSEDEVDGDHTVVLITERAPKAYRAHLREVGVSYLICGRNDVDLPLAMRKIRDVLGLKKLTLQGGGKFNGAMLQAGLVDEISQVIVPIVDGGGPEVTGFFDPRGKPAARAVGSLKLMKRQSLGNGVEWFRWLVNPRA